MRIQPRQQLLELWRAVARSSFPDGSWNWGGRFPRNSISDAEQLLCLMTPATEIDSFKLDVPDQTAQDVLEALAVLGDSVALPRRLIRVLADYMRAYTDESGMPVFAGGSYFGSAEPLVEPTEPQRRLDIVDSFSMSITLSLATIGFLRVFRGMLTREDLLREAAELEAMASARLSAAMVGLLRSFAVHVFDINSPAGQALCRTVNQADRPTRRVVEDLRQALREINAGLRDVTVGASHVVELDNPNQLFECGWSWGVVRGAPAADTSEPVGHQPEGVAQAAPYLYFTVVALDGIQDLFSERTRILGLLNEEQHRLARALQLRWDLTQSYWATIASFGGGRWPLEDLPWRTTDEVESDYSTLLVTSIMVQSLANRSAPDTELIRVGRLLEDLATRARITRRPLANDPALALHSPGVTISLEGSEARGPARLSWGMYDFSPQLLKRTLRVAGLLTGTEHRGELLDLADRIWDHLVLRRHKNGPGSMLWDQPSDIYPEIKPNESEVSWYYTERVVECLVAAALVVSRPPLRSPRLTSYAGDLLSEAEHLFDQELLMVSAEAGPAMSTVLQTARATLRRARDVLPDRPGSAVVLVSDVLRELDRLAAARLSFRGTG
jgi:hypothetical protein